MAVRSGYSNGSTSDLVSADKFPDVDFFQLELLADAVIGSTFGSLFRRWDFCQNPRRALCT